jgi:hypothetical protein
MKKIKEAHYRSRGNPAAYNRDMYASTAGMHKRDSEAYRRDGGANDEGWGSEPKQYSAPTDRPVLLGMFFYNVKPGQEDAAAMYGVKQTKSGKWAKSKYSTSGRSFDMQKQGADREFGQGRWWAPTNESTEVTEEMIAAKLKKDLEVFKRGQRKDSELSDKPRDREIQKKVK